MHNRIVDKLLGGLPGGNQSTAEGEAHGAAGAVGRRLAQSRHAAERFVAKHPAICLGAAAAAGILIGWWIKRR